MSSKNLRFSAGQSGELDPIELEAARWLLLRDKGLSAAQEGELAQWLRTDERHARMFEKLEQTWRWLDRVPPARLPFPPRRRRSPPVWKFGAYAAAAALLIFLVRTSGPGPTAMQIARSAVTPIGGFEQMDLPDGSVVRLNTASAVDVAYSATERRVQLTQGEASFAVAKDPARPFIVRVGAVDVSAVGTVFTIKRGSGMVEVLVTEGRVRVNDAVSGESLLAPMAVPSSAAEAGRLSPTQPMNTHSLLAAGQRLTIPTGAQTGAQPALVAPVAPDEAARALAWQHRRLEFSQEPLAKVVAEFNRYNRHQLVIGDARLGSQRFGGKFPADDFDSFVHVLETSFGVAVERGENETVLRLRR